MRCPPHATNGVAVLVEYALSLAVSAHRRGYSLIRALLSLIRSLIPSRTPLYTYTPHLYLSISHLDLSRGSSGATVLLYHVRMTCTSPGSAPHITELPASFVFLCRPLFLLILSHLPLSLSIMQSLVPVSHLICCRLAQNT